MLRFIHLTFICTYDFVFTNPIRVPILVHYIILAKYQVPTNKIKMTILPIYYTFTITNEKTRRIQLVFLIYLHSF